MAKINIEITKIETGFFTKKENIVKIEINNGNWKYWDRYMETDEMESLTINTINKAHYLTQPVKDALPTYDQTAWEQDREIVVDGAYVRDYNTLLEYLNCRIQNVKEYRSIDEMEFDAVLLKQVTMLNKDNGICENLVYEMDGRIEIKIRAE